MADLYIGSYGKKGEYLVPTTNFQDHKVTFTFDGCKLHLADDALHIGLHCTAIDGASKSSKFELPCSILLTLHTKPYEYESGYGDNKKKETIEPTNREKLLYQYLTSDDDEFNWEKNQGKGGTLLIGSYSNDAAILAGEGNAKKHARFVLEFDDDIKPFDMSGDNFRLDNLSDASGKKGGKGGYSGESEAQKIEARKQAIKAVLKGFVAISPDASDEAFLNASVGLSDNPKFAVLVSLHLGLPIPSNLGHWTF